MYLNCFSSENLTNILSDKSEKYSRTFIYNINENAYLWEKQYDKKLFWGISMRNWFLLKTNLSENFPCRHISLRCLRCIYSTVRRFCGRQIIVISAINTYCGCRMVTFSTISMCCGRELITRIFSFSDAVVCDSGRSSNFFPSPAYFLGSVEHCDHTDSSHIDVSNYFSGPFWNLARRGCVDTVCHMDQPVLFYVLTG